MMTCGSFGMRAIEALRAEDLLRGSTLYAQRIRLSLEGDVLRN